MKIHIEELTEMIRRRANKFRVDYGIDPFDVCLGPDEFATLYHSGNDACTVPDWHYALSGLFYQGMRLRRMSSPGVLVGCLTNKEVVTDNSQHPQTPVCPPSTDEEAKS